MDTMSRRSHLPYRLLLALVGFAVIAAGVGAQDTAKWNRKYKSPPQSSRIEVTILKADNGKPIENAAVIFHPVEGDRDKGALELKTNEDGKAIIDVIPVGDTVRLQVIAHGFQTYGQDYKVDKAEMSMEVRMKRPGQQYSIYKDKGATANSGSGSGSDKPANPDKNANPPAQGDKGSGSGNQSSAQPDSHSDSNPPPSK